MEKSQQPCNTDYTPSPPAVEPLVSIDADAGFATSEQTGDSVAANLDFAQGVARRLPARFRDAAYSRLVRAALDGPLEAQRDRAAAQALRDGTSVSDAVSSVQLDPATIPSLQS